MDFRIIEDRIELNGFEFGRLSHRAPASLMAWFRSFLDGLDENDIDGQSYESGRAAGYDDGYSAGASSRDDEFEDAEAELSDTRQILLSLFIAVKDNDEDLIEGALKDAESILK